MSQITLDTDGIPTISPRPAWYKRPVTWIISGVIAVATAAALVVGLVATSPSGPAGRLTSDGYSVVTTLSHDQLKTMAGNDKDGQLGVSFVENAAYGTKGSQAEIVVQLTDSGKSMFSNPLMAGILSGAASSDGVNTHVDGSYLIISGPADKISSNGWGLGS